VYSSAANPYPFSTFSIGERQAADTHSMYSNTGTGSPPESTYYCYSRRFSTFNVTFQPFLQHPAPTGTAEPRSAADDAASVSYHAQGAVGGASRFSCGSYGVRVTRSTQRQGPTGECRLALFHFKGRERPYSLQQGGGTRRERERGAAKAAASIIN
jgi:hypothetical protein